MKNLYKSLFGLLLIGAIVSCTELELPEAGSLPDKTPPSADFGVTVTADYQTIEFSNFSISATTYAWDFGNGTTSSEKDPTVTFEDGRYLVTLTASDKLGVESTYSDSVIIEKPTSTFQPIIQNPGYDIEGDDSYRNFWRNADLGGVIQITSSPVHEGVKSAKLPSGGDRIGYQLFTVEPEVTYVLKFWYTMKTTPVGTMTIAVLDGEVTNPADIPAKTLASVTVNDQTDANLYVEEQLEFTSGTGTEVAIYFSNVDVESRIDTWSITVK